MPNISSMMYNLSSTIGNVGAKLSVPLGQPNVLANRIISKELMGAPFGVQVSIFFFKKPFIDTIKNLQKRYEIQPYKVFEAVTRNTHRLWERCRKEAPINTGFLRNSLITAAGYDRKHPDWIVGKVICTAPYGMYVHFGTLRWHKKIYPKESKALRFKPVSSSRVGYFKVKDRKTKSEKLVTKSNASTIRGRGNIYSDEIIFRKWVRGQKANPFMRRAFRATYRSMFSRIATALKPRQVESIPSGKVPALPLLTSARHQLTHTARWIRNVSPYASFSVAQYAQRYGRRLYTKKIVSKMVIRRR